MDGLTPRKIKHCLECDRDYACSVLKSAMVLLENHQALHEPQNKAKYLDFLKKVQDLGYNFPHASPSCRLKHDESQVHALIDEAIKLSDDFNDHVQTHSTFKLGQNERLC